MKILLAFIFIFCFLNPSFAAQKRDHWYKVETKEEPEKTESEPPYQYDSVEAQNKNKNWNVIGFWSLKPKISIGTGFFIDKGLIEGDHTKPIVLGLEFTFLDKAWYRWKAGGLIGQNQNFIANISWDYTPSRKQMRFFYGAGAAVGIFARDEIRNLVEMDNYFITASLGLESLLTAKEGWRAEVKGYLGMESYAVQLFASYIWHL